MMESLSPVKPKRVRLKDVAQAAQLSVSGVSLALKEHPSISKETVARVRAIAEELGYCPDPVMSALAAHRSRRFIRSSSRVIAMIGTMPNLKDQFERFAFQKLFDSAHSKAEQLGYKLEYFDASNERCEGSRLEQILVSRGIESVILAPSGNGKIQLDFDWEQFHIVSIGRTNGRSAGVYCDRNWIEDMRMASVKLSKQGVSKIGFLLDPNHSVLGSVNQGCFIADIPVFPSNRFYVFDQSLMKQSSIDSVCDWIQTHRLDGIIGVGRSFASMTREFGTRFLQEISYASLDVVEEDSVCMGIDPQYELLGQVAVDLVHSQLLENRKGFGSGSIGTWVDGVWKNIEEMLSYDESPMRMVV